MALDGGDPLAGLPGVGPATVARLARAGLARVEQLALWAPRRYDDAGAVRAIAALAAGELAYVEGVVRRATVRRFFRRATLEVTIDDGSGGLLLRWFRFRGAVPDRFALGRRVRAAGRVRAGKRGLEMAQPIADPVEDAPRLGGAVALRARYAPIAGVPPARLEKLAALAARAGFPEPLVVPPDLPSLADAVAAVHLVGAPLDETARAALVAGRSAAHRRLAFESLLRVRLRVRAGLATEAERGRPLVAAASAADVLAPLLAALPFAPTAAQRREIAAVAVDLAGARPMRRLLTGDVGSGKTLVAAAAIELAAASGARAALLAPTAILAEQQAEVLARLLSPTGRRVALLHGGTPARARTRLRAELAARDGAVDVVVGTHALLDEALAIAGLALVVIDEQQRFGVAARAALVDKARGAGVTPHQLALSATPIPRTLALALRGELTLGHLEERPPGRAPVPTELWTDDAAGPRAIEAARAAIAEGGQVYWVCPQIDARPDVAGVLAVAARLEAALGGPIAICHGRQAPRTRAAQMAAFRAGAPVLVATTVIEVGIDVPAATLVAIESPERLGLSTLHQLRGRVGRGSRRGRCLLVAPRASPEERTRLSALLELDEGLQVAEADLARRGMGELAGAAQSGLPSLPPLPAAELQRLVEAADRAAEEILRVDPQLSQPGHLRLARALADAMARSYSAVDGG